MRVMTVRAMSVRVVSVQMGMLITVCDVGMMCVGDGEV